MGRKSGRRHGPKRRPPASKKRVTGGRQAHATQRRPTKSQSRQRPAASPKQTSSARRPFRNTWKGRAIIFGLPVALAVTTYFVNRHTISSHSAREARRQAASRAAERRRVAENIAAERRSALTASGVRPEQLSLFDKICKIYNWEPTGFGRRTVSLLNRVSNATGIEPYEAMRIMSSTKIDLKHEASLPSWQGRSQRLALDLAKMKKGSAEWNKARTELNSLQRKIMELSVVRAFSAEFRKQANNLLFEAFSSAFKNQNAEAKISALAKSERAAKRKAATMPSR